MALMGPRYRISNVKYSVWTVSQRPEHDRYKDKWEHLVCFHLGNSGKMFTSQPYPSRKSAEASAKKLVEIFEVSLGGGNGNKT